MLQEDPRVPHRSAAAGSPRRANDVGDQGAGRWKPRPLQQSYILRAEEVRWHVRRLRNQGRWDMQDRRRRPQLLLRPNILRARRWYSRIHPLLNA